MIARRFTPPGRPRPREKCRRNDFQNASFVLSGRLSVGVARRGPVAHAGPCSPGGGAVFLFPMPS
jgi:hypothetical protein